MSLPTTMKAVVIEGKTAVVKSGVPLPNLPNGSMMIKPMAVGGNPTDWKHIEYGLGPQGAIEGCDVAGEIVQLTPDVDTNKFHLGDFVYGFVHGASVRAPDNGAYAEYVALDSKLAFTAPKSLQFSDKDLVPAGAITTYEAAASIPGAWTTAGGSLFHHFNMKYDWEPKEPQHNFPILIWGGSSVLGQSLVQLAKKYHGYSKIVVVASKKHEALLKGYGADDVFDYHDSDVIQQIKSKYPNIPHLLDLISTKTTLQQVYQCASDTEESTILNYYGLNIESIDDELKRDNVKIVNTFIYFSLGFDLPLGGNVLKYDPQYRADIVKFIEEINPRLYNGDFQHPPIKVYYNGLEDTIQIMKDLEAGKASGEKLVAVFK